MGNTELKFVMLKSILLGEEEREGGQGRGEGREVT